MSGLFQLRIYIRILPAYLFVLLSARTGLCAHNFNFSQMSGNYEFNSSVLGQSRIFSLRQGSINSFGAISKNSDLSWISIDDQNFEVVFKNSKSTALISVSSKIGVGTRTLYFELDNAGRRYHLVRADYSPNREMFNESEDELTGSSVNSDSVDEMNLKPLDANCMPRANTNAEKLLSATGIDEIAQSGVLKSCGQATESVAKSLWMVREKALSCVANFKDGKYQEHAERIKIALMIRKPNLQITCTNQKKSSTNRELKKLNLAQDALVNTKDPTKIVPVLLHELIHFSGLKNENETQAIAQACGDAIQTVGESSRVEALAASAQASEKLNIDSATIDLSDTVINAAASQPVAHPTKLVITEGSADQVQAVKSAVAKYNKSSNVLRREVARTFDRMPALIPTAYASTSSRSKPSNSEAYTAEPVGFNENGPILKFSDNSLGQVSIPFSKETGFDKMSYRKIESADIPKFNALVAQPSGEIGSRIGSSAASAAPASARVPTGKVTANSDQGESGAFVSAASAASTSSGGSVMAAASSASSSNAPSRGSGRATADQLSASSAPTKSYSFKSWNDAWSQLKTSPNPEEILRSEELKQILAPERKPRQWRRISFRGNLYGPIDAKRIINLDSYWNPK